MMFFSAQNIRAGYGRNDVLKNISFSMEAGCLMGILGANGSGKTTLIKAITNILPHEGTCLLEGTKLETLPPKQIAKLVSYIPQRSGISIDITALDVVLMGFNPQLPLLEQPTGAMVDSARQALAWVGLGGQEEKNYLHLSEGQKQLCILARTIVSGSRLLLLDEPESALDFCYRYRMLNMLRDWTAETGGGAVITLHDPVLALNSCDKLMVLKNGELLKILSPKEDRLEQTEQVLCQIYGPVGLQICKTRSGQEVITMVKEDGE